LCFAHEDTSKVCIALRGLSLPWDSLECWGGKKREDEEPLWRRILKGGNVYFIILPSGSLPRPHRTIKSPKTKMPSDIGWTQKS
jgi:hypothetical protein